jgi:hypothetical protein
MVHKARHLYSSYLQACASVLRVVDSSLGDPNLRHQFVGSNIHMFCFLNTREECVHEFLQH